jgi:iron complex outermembrane recepter protein
MAYGYKSGLLSVSALVGAAMLAPSAFAQEAGPDSEGLGEIVVTAERREGNLQETPIAVSAFSAATLEDRQVDSTQDIQRLVPGLKLVDNLTSPTNFTISLRGSTQQDASLVVAESPVGIYVDDIYIGRLNGANAQLADIARVEVLRGPQGTLYGRNTLAGALKIVTQSPGDSLALSASALYGDYGRYRVSGAVSGPIAGGWSGSVAGLVDGFDGYFKNIVTGQDTGAQENSAVRAKLRYDEGGAFDAEIGLSYARGRNDGYTPTFAIFPGTPQTRSSQLIFGLGDPYQVAIAPNPGLPAPIRSLPVGETDQTIASLNVSYDFGWATARSITGFVKTEDFFSVEFTGVGAFAGANRSETDQFSQEFQLLGTSADEKMEWIAGAYFFTEKADQVVALVTDDLLKIDTDSIAVFGQWTYNFTDQLSATAGVRYTQDEKSFEGTIRNFVSLTPIFPTVRLRNTYDAFSPKFGLDYKVDTGGAFDSMLLYASAAKGFKSGGYNGIAFGNIDVLRTPYAPETNWTYEAGVKTDLFGNRLRVNVAAYLNNITDITLNATSTGPGGVSFPIQNAGDAEVKGIELELFARPLSGLDLFANVTLQDAEYTRVAPGSSAAIAAATFGEAKLAQLPDFAFTIGGSYTLPVNFLGDDEFTVGIDHVYTDDYFIAVGNEVLIEGYGMTNAFIGYRYNNAWSARLAATNLEDEANVISAVGVFSSATVTPPRQVTFTVSYQY